MPLIKIYNSTVQCEKCKKYYSISAILRSIPYKLCDECIKKLYSDDLFNHKIQNYD